MIRSLIGVLVAVAHICILIVVVATRIAAVVDVAINIAVVVVGIGAASVITICVARFQTKLAPIAQNSLQVPYVTDC